MADGARLAVDGTALRLSGELGFPTVAQVLQAGRDAIAASPGPDALLDLSGVTRADSAGLALVVDWMRAAHERGLAMRLCGVPEQLAHIAEVSGLEELIGAETGDAA